MGILFHGLSAELQINEQTVIASNIAWLVSFPAFMHCQALTSNLGTLKWRRGPAVPCVCQPGFLHHLVLHCMGQAVARLLTREVCQILHVLSFPSDICSSEQVMCTAVTVSIIGHPLICF